MSLEEDSEPQMGTQPRPNFGYIRVRPQQRPQLHCAWTSDLQIRLLCTTLLGVWYLILNAAVLLILLSALTDPDYHHFSSSDLGGDFEFMDDADMCIAIVISVLMILICAMVTYRAYKQYTAWIIPFFCYQIFDFSLNTLVAVTIPVYPNSIQEYTQQLPPDFPYKDDIMSVNPTCSVLVILLFTSIILAFKGYLISCVWNCYRYIDGRNSSDVLVYVTSNDTTS
ncbi:lysosomal-associated transmembrane protein 4B-like [Budorcas taxicolor]|uniref:lysosomal-associated transmembrane protein 4B-like n=1 Tax=Budorcas taxicolor TaxID=37181 RepID=UPI0022833F93|nr:lysosomal-associated transmembrane protein 4B-like [Budorcas taxicolor]